jgi:hypothetical protein
VNLYEEDGCRTRRRNYTPPKSDQKFSADYIHGNNDNLIMVHPRFWAARKYAESPMIGIGRRGTFIFSCPLRVFHRALLAAVAACFAASGGAAAEQDNHAWPQAAVTNFALEQFKTFVSSPPIISNLVFERKMPMEGGARPLDGSFARSTKWEYYHARWQTNGFLLRRISTPDDVTNSTVADQLVSWSGHQHALFEPYAQLATWDDRDPTTFGKDISIFYTRRFFLEPLAEVLNMGIMHLGTGSVRWEGNQFHTSCKLDGEALLIRGEIIPALDGPPRSMRVSYAFAQRTNDYLIRYGYGNSRSPYLPGSITNFWLSPIGPGVVQEVDLDEWNILDLQVADQPLATESFAASRFNFKSSWATRNYTNGGFYQRAPDGTLRLIALLAAQGGASITAGRAKLGAFYVGWGGLNIAIFALIVRVRNRTKTSKKGLNK